jgi:rod shape-determining protein MreD
MKYVFLAVSSFLAIVAQTIAGRNFFLFNYLDLSLILIAYWAINRSRVQALFVGSLTGVLLDAVFGWPLGYNGFGKTLAAFVIGQAAKHLNAEENWIRFVLIASSSALSSLSVLALFALLQHAFGAILLGASLVQAITTAAVGVLVLAAIDNHTASQVRRVS